MLFQGMSGDPGIAGQPGHPGMPGLTGPKVVIRERTVSYKITLNCCEITVSILFNRDLPI